MRIMHLESGRHLYGGAEQVRYLIEGLEAQGVENVLVCPRASQIAGATRADRVVELPMGGDVDARLPGRLRKVMDIHSPSILHVHSRRGADTAGGWSARWARVPAVLTRRVDNRELAAWARLKYRPYRAIVAISSAVEDELVSHVGLDPARVFCVRSAVSSEHYRPANIHDRVAASVGVPPDAYMTGVVAQLIPRKGHALLLDCLPEIVSRHPDVYVLCFGRGPLRDALSRQVDDLGLEGRVKFMGFRDDLPALIPGLDLLVHPAEREGLGVAVLEAMSSGVPVIVSTAGGLPDIIDHETHGLLFESGNRRALVDAIERMLAEPELAERFKSAGRQRTKDEFSVERMSQRYLEIYARALGAAPT